MKTRESLAGIFLRVKAVGAASLVTLSFLLPFTGCIHKVPIDKRVFSLEGSAEFPIMVPSSAPRTRDDFQNYQMETAGKQMRANPPNAGNCMVKGDVFSLAPARSANPRQWVVTSLNAEGWEHRGDTIDLELEWTRFAHEVLGLQRSGCLPNDESPEETLRQILEVIPVPADEELLYNYSLSRSGFVDLVPGMQIVIERASFQTKEGKAVPASINDEFKESFEVIRRQPSGTALRLAETVSRGQGRTLDSEGNLLRSVSDRFAASSSLGLMLLTLRDDSTRRFPALLGSTEAIELWNASDEIVSGAVSECPPYSSNSRLECLFFGKDAAVSVLLSVWVNGHRSFYPLGTSLGSLIGRMPERAGHRALASVVVERALVGGGYMRVNFPHDSEGARKVILLNGDRLRWQH